MAAEGRTARLLGLRSGEGRPVGLAMAASFFASAGLMIGQSGIEALFFARYGVSKLPVMYLVLGGTMFVLTIGFGALLGRLGRGRACLSIPVVLALAAAAGRIALAADIAWITQALWLLQGAAQFLVGLAVWGLAGIVTDTRQAKRFFPLIGAGSVLGYVIGGLVTKPLASTIGSPNLLLVWIATLIAVVVLGARLLAIGGDGERRSLRSRRRGDAGPIEQLLRGLRYARRSTLMRWMALGSILFSLLFFSLYLPFSRAATTRYPDPDELAGFFGLFFGLSTGVAFLLSLFMTNRLLKRFGVPTVLLVLPLLYVVTFGVLAIDASFAILAMFRFAQVAWMSGGAISSWEAVINTVPTDRRDQTRAFLYGGPTQVGTMLAGVIALVGGSLSPATLYGVGLASAVVATVAMIGVRRAYPRELVKALREGRPHVFDAVPVGAEPFGLPRADRSALVAATDALGDPDPRVRRVAAHVLGDMVPEDAEEPLTACLRDDDPGVRATAIASLARAGSTDALPSILERADDPDAAVRRATVEAVAALGRVRDGPAAVVLGARMLDTDPIVRARAAAVLVASGGDQAGAAALNELAHSDVDEVRASTFGAMRGLHAPGLLDAALAGLADPVSSVRAEAAGALATLDPGQALDPLVDALADDQPFVRAAVARALGVLGDPAVGPVTGSLTAPDRRDGALAALEHLPLDGRTDEVHAFAVAMVDQAVESHQLSAAIDEASDQRLALLRDSLLSRSERQAVLGLRAAAVLGGRSAMSVALENLSVTDAAQRANALEVIESVGARELVKPLLSMWDGSPSNIDRDELFERLRDDPDDWIRACTALAFQTDPDRHTRPEGATMTRTLATLSPMERVLFLRDVPLFSALPPPDLQPIAAIAEEHAYADGDTIAEQGEAGDSMHIIVSGEVSVVVREAAGEDRVVAVRHSGDVVGEMSVITNEPRIATLLARGDVRVLSIARPQFESILRERPETAIGVIRVLSQRLAEPSASTATDGTGTTTTSV
jgi:HEAT repeat protein